MSENMNIYASWMDTLPYTSLSMHLFFNQVQMYACNIMQFRNFVRPFECASEYGKAHRMIIPILLILINANGKKSNCNGNNGWTKISFCSEKKIEIQKLKPRYTQYIHIYIIYRLNMFWVYECNETNKNDYNAKT